MKKVLIISYFYPPGNFAGSYRIKAWAEHLHKFGYYPIVVTRHWVENETDYTAISDEKEIKKEEFGHYTVYRLPYNGSFRDRLVKRYGPRAIPLGKFFSFFQVIGQNYFLRSIPYRNIYDFSRKLLKENPDIKIVLTSGRPFVHFRFAHLLKNEFPHINWIADYRDAWNSDSMIDGDFDRRIQRFFEKSREKEWVDSASLITAVSDGLASELSKHLNKKTKVIYNGFEPADYGANEIFEKKTSLFKIVYNGTLYRGQPVIVFLKIFKRISSDFQGKVLLDLVFAGSKPNKTIEEFIKKNPGLNICITDRMSKSEVILLQKNANILLMIGHRDQKGIVSSKIFEYFGLRIPIFLCPGDNDILENLVKKTNTGYVCKNREEGYLALKKIIEEFIKNGEIAYYPLEREVIKYTRENQTRRFAEMLNEL